MLDSVVLPDGPEPFYTPTFQAIPAVLRELCSGRACAGITPNPVTEMALLVSHLRKHALGGSVYDGSGRRHGASSTRSGCCRRSRQAT